MGIPAAKPFLGVSIPGLRSIQGGGDMPGGKGGREYVQGVGILDGEGGVSMSRRWISQSGRG